MVGWAEVVNVWIPEHARPGDFFLLEKKRHTDNPRNPFVGILACPECGMLGLVSHFQTRGLEPVICSSDECSCEFLFLPTGEIIPRKPM